MSWGLSGAKVHLKWNGPGEAKLRIGMQQVTTGQSGSCPNGLSMIFFLVLVYPEVLPKYCNGH